MPVFIEEATCKIITESLNFSIKNKRLGVNAYVIMPNHMHAIVFDKDFDNERLKHTLDDLRKFTGRQLLDYADANLPKSHLVKRFVKMQRKTVNASFGNPHNTPKGYLQKSFIDRSSITFI